MNKQLDVTLLVIVLTGCVYQCFSRQFQNCSLATQLLKNGISRNQLTTWLCIMHHESRLKTDALNKYNSDGSMDHGIFQINDRYWCSPGRHNVCNITCISLRNEDITDDIKCAKTIYQEQGFKAWYSKSLINIQ